MAQNGTGCAHALLDRVLSFETDRTGNRNPIAQAGLLSSAPAPAANKPAGCNKPRAKGRVAVACGGARHSQRHNAIAKRHNTLINIAFMIRCMHHIYILLVDLLLSTLTQKR